MSASRLAALALIAPGMAALAACTLVAPGAESIGTGGAEPDRESPPIDFATEVQPILEARCMPCHFEGGKMYAELPFDQPVTLHLLGEKLFTRIREPAEQELIRTFLAQTSPPASATETAEPPPG